MSTESAEAREAALRAEVDGLAASLSERDRALTACNADLNRAVDMARAAEAREAALRARIEGLADKTIESVIDNAECIHKDPNDDDVWDCSVCQAAAVTAHLRALAVEDTTPEPTPADEPQAEAGARLVWWRLVEAMTTALGCDVQAWRDHETGEWSATCATCGCDVDEDGCANAQRLATAADQALRPAPVADDAAEPPAEDGA